MELLPIVLALIVHEIGYASVIHIKNPSILAITRELNLAQIREDLLDNHTDITVVLPPKHVVLNVANALRRDSVEVPNIVGLDTNPPAQAVAGIERGHRVVRVEARHPHCSGLREQVGKHQD